MKTLVVVHTENSYLSEGCVQTRRVFERIAAELKQNWLRGGRVYYLPGDSNGLEDAYPAIREQLAGAVIIPSEGYERQFLKTKRRLITRKVREVSLCGISYYSCVKDLCTLLRGETSGVSKMSYCITAERMGWTKDSFNRLCDTRINAQIIERLTDKLISE